MPNPISRHAAAIAAAVTIAAAFGLAAPATAQSWSSFSSIASPTNTSAPMRAAFASPRACSSTRRIWVCPPWQEMRFIRDVSAVASPTQREALHSAKPRK